MVLLVTIGLVIISAVTLVVGFVQDSVGWIYASIGCSIAAAVILIISARTGRAAPVASGAGPSTLDYVGDATVATDVAFPISDYDELLVTEIIPLLAALDVFELEQVRAREQAGKARTSVLRRIDTELDERSSAPAAGTVTEAVLAEEEPSLADAFAASDDDDDGVGGLEFDDEPFPIEDYDDLRVGEVLPLLPQLYADELDLVAARERAGAGRAAVLDRIAELLEGDDDTVAVDVVEAVDAEPVKSALKKSAPKKTTSKQATPLKRSASQQSSRTLTPSKAAKKAPAKKAPAKKAAATKAPAAKKAPATKAAPNKAPANKAPAKKAPAKKAPAKKASR